MSWKEELKQDFQRVYGKPKITDRKPVIDERTLAQATTQPPLLPGTTTYSFEAGLPQMLTRGIWGLGGLAMRPLDVPPEEIFPRLAYGVTPPVAYEAVRAGLRRLLGVPLAPRTGWGVAGRIGTGALDILFPGAGMGATAGRLAQDIVRAALPTEEWVTPTLTIGDLPEAVREQAIKEFSWRQLPKEVKERLSPQLKHFTAEGKPLARARLAQEWATTREGQKYITKQAFEKWSKQVVPTPVKVPVVRRGLAGLLTRTAKMLPTIGGVMFGALPHLLATAPLYAPEISVPGEMPALTPEEQAELETLTRRMALQEMRQYPYRYTPPTAPEWIRGY